MPSLSQTSLVIAPDKKTGHECFAPTHYFVSDILYRSFYNHILHFVLTYYWEVINFQYQYSMKFCAMHTMTQFQKFRGALARHRDDPQNAGFVAVNGVDLHRSYGVVQIGLQEGDSVPCIHCGAPSNNRDAGKGMALSAIARSHWRRPHWHENLFSIWQCRALCSRLLALRATLKFPW